MRFLCIDCYHNMETLLDTPMGYDPTEVCFICVEEEAQRLADKEGEDVEYVLENLWDAVRSVRTS